MPKREGPGDLGVGDDVGLPLLLGLLLPSTKPRRPVAGLIALLAALLTALLAFADTGRLFGIASFDLG